MPNDKFINARSKWIGAKVEDERGTAEALAAADFAILAYDPEFNQETEFERREPAGLATGSIGSEPTEHAGRARFRVELRGSGTAGTLPLWASTLLIGCGMSADGGELSLISDFDDQVPITLGLQVGPKRKVLAGAMGNCILTGETGRRTFAEFDFRGVWQTPVDATKPADIEHESTRPLKLKDATVTVGAFTPKIGSFRLDFGNQIELRQDQSAAAGILHAYLANRLPTFEFDPEAKTVADHDLFGQWIAGTTAALAVELGATASNQLHIAAPRLQYVDPREATRRGLQTHQVTGDLNAAGDDDQFTLDFGSAA